MQQQYIERVVDLTEPEANQIYRLSVAKRERDCIERIRGGRGPHSGLVCARCARRQDGEDGALP